MNEDTKQQTKSTAKTVGVASIGAAIVAAITYLVLPPSGPVGKPINLQWDKNNVGADYWYEFASTTNLAKSNSWYFKARVRDTNRIVFYATNEQEFFAVRAAFPLGTTTSNGVVTTNWLYSEYSQISNTNN